MIDFIVQSWLMLTIGGLLLLSLVIGVQWTVSVLLRGLSAVAAALRPQPAPARGLQKVSS